MPTARSLKAAMSLTRKEATFGTQIADGQLTDMLKMTEIDFAKIEKDYLTDEDEINGYAGPTEIEVVARRGSLARKFRASVQSLAAFVIWTLGRLTTTGVGPSYTHTVKWPQICTLNPVSFSMIEGLDCAGATATYFLYKGMVVEQVVIEINGKDPVLLTLNCKTDGSETAKASFTFPAAFSAVDRLLGSMLTLKLGPALENISSVFRTLKITINCGITEPPNVSSAVNVAEYQYGESNPDLQIELSIKADKSHAVYGYFQNTTTVKFEAHLVHTAATKEAKLKCEAVKVECEPTREGLETRLNVKVLPMWNATDEGPGIWTFINSVASYLQ